MLADDRKQTGPGTSKNRKNGTHTTVRSRITVAHNLRDQPYPMKASIAQRQRSGYFEERYRSLWLSVGSIRSVLGSRLGVGSYCGAQLYNSSTQQYSSTAAEQGVYVIQNTEQTHGGASK